MAKRRTPWTHGHFFHYVTGAGSPIPVTAPQAGRTIATATAQTRITPPSVQAVQRVSGAAKG
ncbi:hypothetical protein [Comamonas kerstersii]|uniref:hypothetical protein n=1 Tax=Comamonas kerstersii TaxID=225992 RepID=UPI00266B7677|nr:hypothetical protein [Comamonas kerstersii]